MDLLALNIQRGRDHGIPGYVEYRRLCRVGNANSFEDLRSNIAADKIQILRRHYPKVEDIDLFVGMSMENPGFEDAIVGQTYLCLLGDQFARLKKGDSFFYDLGNRPSSFTLEQLDEIRKASMARIFCDNTDIGRMQPLAFQQPNTQV